MTEILFTNARVFDASGAQPFDGEVLVQGQRIAQVRHGRHNIARGTATQVIDAVGAFLMPGMTEAHTHFGWNDQPTLAAIQMMPPEEHTLWASAWPNATWTWAGPRAWARPPPSRGWTW